MKKIFFLIWLFFSFLPVVFSQDGPKSISDISNDQNFDESPLNNLRTTSRGLTSINMIQKGDGALGPVWYEINEEKKEDLNSPFKNIRTIRCGLKTAKMIKKRRGPSGSVLADVKKNDLFIYENEVVIIEIKKEDLIYNIQKNCTGEDCSAEDAFIQYLEQRGIVKYSELSNPSFINISEHWVGKFLEAGLVNVFRKEERTYLKSYKMADYSYFHSQPLCAEESIVFLMPKEIIFFKILKFAI